MQNLVSHPNSAGLTPITEYMPLRSDEGPYYENINRGSKSAYDYADSINKIFSYSGSVLVLKPRPGDITAYTLYDVVGINTDNTFSVVSLDDTITRRLGMIMGIYDYVPGDTRYIISVYAPLLDLPTSKVIPGAVGSFLYFNPFTKWLSLTALTGNTIFSSPVATKKSDHTLYWYGIGTPGFEPHRHNYADIDDLPDVTSPEWSSILSKPAQFPALPHKDTHSAGGSDAIKLDALAAPDDNTTLNTSTTAHGLMPKLSGNSAETFCGDGQWRSPTLAAVPLATTSANGLLRQLSGNTADILRGDGTWAAFPIPQVSFTSTDSDFSVDGPAPNAGWITQPTTYSTELSVSNAFCKDGILNLLPTPITDPATLVVGTPTLVPVLGLWKTCPATDFVAWARVYSAGMIDHNHSLGVQSSVLMAKGGFGGLAVLDSATTINPVKALSTVASVAHIHPTADAIVSPIVGLVSPKHQVYGQYVTQTGTPGIATYGYSVIGTAKKMHPNPSSFIYQRVRRKNGVITYSVSYDGKLWFDVSLTQPDTTVYTHVGICSFCVGSAAAASDYNGVYVDFFKMSTNPDTSLFS